MSGDMISSYQTVSTESYILKDEIATEGDAKIPYDFSVEAEDEGSEDGNMIFEDYIVDGKVKLDKDIEVDSVIISQSSSLDLNGYTLICHGDFSFEQNGDFRARSSELIFNNGEIICSGNFNANMSKCLINMSKTNDHLVVDGKLELVYGSFTFLSGTVEVKGDVNVTSYFKATGDNTFVLSGDKKQVLSQTEGSRFSKVILKNYSE